jgi:hypothetical protein
MLATTRLFYDVQHFIVKPPVEFSDHCLLSVFLEVYAQREVTQRLNSDFGSFCNLLPRDLISCLIFRQSYDIHGFFGLGMGGPIQVFIKYKFRGNTPSDLENTKENFCQLDYPFTFNEVKKGIKKLKTRTFFLCDLKY